jgi:hypothetical protein
LFDCTSEYLLFALILYRIQIIHIVRMSFIVCISLFCIVSRLSIVSVCLVSRYVLLYPDCPLCLYVLFLDRFYCIQIVHCVCMSCFLIRFIVSRLSIVSVCLVSRCVLLYPYCPLCLYVLFLDTFYCIQIVHCVCMSCFSIRFIVSRLSIVSVCLVSRYVLLYPNCLLCLNVYCLSQCCIASSFLMCLFVFPLSWCCIVHRLAQCLYTFRFSWCCSVHRLPCCQYVFRMSQCCIVSSFLMCL